MNDEELLAELRRTLHDRAAGLRPSPGRLPGAETSGAQQGGGAAPTGEAYDRDPTSRLRILGAGGRSRPVLVAGAVLAAAAGIAAAVAVALSGPTHSKVTFTTQQTSFAPVPTTLPSRPALTTPVTTAPPTPTTIPSPPSNPVPPGFQPLSVTFVSTNTGWAVGQYPCGRSVCPALAATTDGGLSWSARATPDIALAGADQANGSTSLSVRFADRLDGWITTSTQLWSTHDGGYEWSSIPDPAGSTSSILDLEAANGVAYLVGLGPGVAETIYSTPVGRDDWAPSPLRLETGAGPVPNAQLVLFGTTGWIIDVDRTTIGGARLAPGAGWKEWTPPCYRANGAGKLAAASTDNLVAACAEGLWGTPDPGTQPNQDWLFQSSDGGATFSPVGPLPVAAAGTYSITAAPGSASTIVIATANGLVGTFDGGRTWAPVFPFASSGAYTGADFVGFTSATQGVAVLGTSTSTSMVMTRDGGHTWQPVTF